MKKELLCIGAAALLAVSAMFPHPVVLAENGEDEGIIIYELGDPRVPAIPEDGVVHNLNENEVLVEDSEDADDRPILVYGKGELRVPAVSQEDVADWKVLVESATEEKTLPVDYYNLGWVKYHGDDQYRYNFRFSDVQECVFTEQFFDPDPDGYIFVSTDGIQGSVRISMLEYEGGKVVSSWEGDPETVSAVGFAGTEGKFYYFKFEPCGKTSVSGSGEIFWGR